MSFLNCQVENWWSTLLPIVDAHLYVNGGPIIMVQVLNLTLIWQWQVKLMCLSDLFLKLQSSRISHQMISDLEMILTD